MNSLPTPPSDVSFHRFLDGGVLFLKGSRRLWALNATSAVIWCLLEEVCGLEELGERLAATFKIAKSQAMDDARALLDHLGREGLFAFPRPDGVTDPETDDGDIQARGPRLVQPSTWAKRFSFIVARHRFEFCCQDRSIGDAFSSIMAHLASDTGGLPATRLAVVANGDGPGRWDVYLDGRGVVDGLSAEEVLPHLATMVFVRTCESLKEYLLFHAAVIGINGVAAMLPGEAGSGKTTLVAGLLAQGGTFYSDELAVLSLDHLQVHPLPLPMSIKPGSVLPLEPHYPGLSRRTVYPRADLKKVRYLSPSQDAVPTGFDQGLPIRCLIFPRYREGARTRWVQLDPLEALQRLSTTGSSNRTFTDRDVQAMIALIEGRPSFEIVFSELPQALSLLKAELSF